MLRTAHLLRAIVLSILLPSPAVQAQVSDPAKLFSREYEYIDARLSPTGEFVAVNTPDGDRRAIAMIKITGEGQRNLFRFAGNLDRWGNVVRKEPISADWSDDSRLIVFEGYDYGRFGSKFLSGNVYATNADGSEQLQLFGYVNDRDNIRSQFKDEGTPYLMDILPDGNGKALFYYIPPVAGNSKYATSIFRIHTHGGRREQIESFPDWVSVTADHSGRPRVNIRYDLEDRQIVQYRPRPDSEWTPMPASISGTALNVWFFEPGDNIAYASISDKGEAAQLYRMDFSAGTRERLGGQPNQEISDYERAGRFGPPVVIRYAAGKPKIDYLDQKSPWAQLHAGLMKAFPGEIVSFIDLTKDESKLLFSTWSDRNPGTYYLLDRKTNTPSLLFKRAEWIDPAQMSPTMPLEFANRNGDTLFAFLTIPKGKSTNMPLVVMPHGGPFGISDSWGFDRDAQFLASLGYAVLRVNYRGSGMRGNSFLESGYKLWGTGIQDDITDGVKHVIAKGLVDANKVCIYGASFGGYSAMMNPIRNPGLYRCAIGYAGVYDLQELYEGEDSSRQSRSFFARTMGNAMTKADHSPVAQIAKLDVPILLIHGKSDRTAPIEQFRIAEAALDRAGKTYETLVKSDEGHGFYRTENQEEAYSRMQVFLQKYNPAH